MQSVPPRSPLRSTGKKALFAVLVTACAFLAFECLLGFIGFRPGLESEDPFVGFESQIPLLVETTVQGRSLMQTAPNKLRYFNPQRFSKQKSPGTTRIFCLGGSTTFGRPFDDRTSYVAWLRELLPLADPNTQWEVINAGGVSYASYRVAAVMDELVQYDPDVFIVYTGHNEFLEERTYAGLKEGSDSIRRWTALLHRSRVFSVARQLTGSEASGFASRTRLPGEVDAILDHSVGPDAYHRDDQLRQHVFVHFEYNLHRMVQAASRAGARMIFVTPASNLKDFSPFKSEFAKTLDDSEMLSWSQLVDQADTSLKAGEVERAVGLLRQAEAIDGGRADLSFRLGQALFETGKFDEARAAFQLAIDQDICPLRAPQGIQQLVEAVAVADRVPLVDFSSIVTGACLDQHGHPCPGNEYFLDHVHPTVSAHRLLALAIVEAMKQSRIVTRGVELGESEIATATRRIESTIDPELQARALTNLAQVLSWAGKQHEAGPIAERAVQMRLQANLPEDPEGMFYAAVSYAVKGQDQEAIELFGKVVQMEPENAHARWRLAALLYDQERFKESLEHFRAAVLLDPTDVYSLRMLGSVLLKLDRYEDALTALNQALELVPDDPAIRSSMEAARKRIAGG